MFENNAKGWYGSYSVIGRNLVQRFALILKKDEIISGNMKKAFYGDYFSTDDQKILEEDNKDKKGNNIDIFSIEYDKLKEEKLKIKEEEKMVKNANLCTHHMLAEKERYKFHQNHHKESERNMHLMRRKDIENFVSYHPKMDFIWKRTVTGPKWKLQKERNLINIENSNFNKNKESKKQQKSKKRTSYINLSPIKFKYKSIPMHKQTRRGILPISYDSRIRTDVAFIPKNFDNDKINSKFSNTFNNGNKQLNKNKQSPKNTSKDIKQKYLKTYSNNFNPNYSKKIFNSKIRINTCPKLSWNSSYSSIKKNPKKNNLIKILDKDTFNRTIDFSKILPRTSNVFVQKKVDETIPPFSTPSYKLTEPRCLSMVSYSKNIRDQIIPKKFVGIDPQIFLEPNKVLDMVNNHKKVSVPNFDIMSGRNKNDGPLPAYMINVWDRRSIETMTDKGLKMNNYSNSNFHSENYSMFKPKKSFNKMINLTIMKNDNEKIDEELKNINEEIFGNKKLQKLIETYAKDEKDYTNNQINFDVISLKSYKRERKKNKNLPLNF